jgi:O-antigen/teichoic acid export membrane protein
MLGLYAFAYTYGTLPGAIVAAIVAPVAFPVFALVREDLAMLHNHLLLFVRLSSLVGIPAMAVSVALAPVAVTWLLGPQWAGGIQPLQLFLLVGSFRAVYPTDQIIRALGKTKWELIMGLVAAPATVIAAVVGSGHGIVVVAALVSAVAVAGSLLSVWLGARLLRVRMARLILVPMPTVIASLGAGLLAWLASSLPVDSALKLLAGVIASGAFYALALWFGRLPGRAELKDLIVYRKLEAAEA